MTLPSDSLVLTTRLDRADADRAIAARLVAESFTHPGIVVSNRGGWHSIPDLAQRPDADLRALMQLLAEHMHEASRLLHHPPSRLALVAWAMVMHDGDYAVAHDHAEATWSSAYYLDPGDADLSTHPDSGRLVFDDGFIDPTPGLLVLFPGTTRHRVAPYRGQRPRVVIAANGKLAKAPA